MRSREYFGIGFFSPTAFAGGLIAAGCAQAGVRITCFWAGFWSLLWMLHPDTCGYDCEGEVGGGGDATWWQEAGMGSVNSRKHGGFLVVGWVMLVTKGKSVDLLED